MLNGIVLKTEQYVIGGGLNLDVILITSLIFTILGMLISFPIALGSRYLDTAAKVYVPILSIIASAISGALFGVIFAGTVFKNEEETATQYYILAKDYNIEIADEYYIYEQDGNMFILRENGK